MNYCSFNWHRAKRSHSPACFTTWSATDWWLLVTSMTSLDFCSFSSPVPWCGEALDRGFCCCISISGMKKKIVTLEQKFGFHSYVSWRHKWPSTTPAPNCPPPQSVLPSLIHAAVTEGQPGLQSCIKNWQMTCSKADWMDLHVMVQCAGIILQAHSIQFHLQLSTVIHSILQYTWQIKKPILFY